MFFCGDANIFLGMSALELMTSYKIALKSLTNEITDEALLAISSENPDMRFERSAEGRLIIMSPTGGITGRRNGDLFGQVWMWNRQYKLGKVFDSSTGFRLPNGAVRAPDVSWIRLTVWNSLTEEEKEKFPPISPDFVLELMSKSDNLRDAQEKMAEYMSCGVKLGWLIIPQQQQVEIYRQGKNKEILNNPSSLSGENVMPNLIVDLSDIF